MGLCSIINCKNRGVKDGGVSFFSFPKDEAVINEWLKHCKPKTTVKSARVCSIHFISSDYQKSLRHTLMNESPKRCRKLKPDAIPTLHIGTADQPTSGSDDVEPVIDESSSSGSAPATVLSEPMVDELKETNNRKGRKSKWSEAIDRLNATEKQLTDIVVNVEMHSEAAVTSKACDANDNDPIRNMEVSPDLMETEKAGVKPSDLVTPELSGFSDVSQFCESVMKLSKETQTSPEPENDTKRARKRKLDPTESHDYFIQMCNKNLPKGMVQLVKWQLNSNENVEDYKFHMFALNLYFSSGNTYNLLKDMMGLPDVNKLKKHFIPKTTKLDNNLINALKIKVDNMSDREKICSLSISSTKLKPHLYYNITRDKIEGLHEIDGVQRIDPARYALVFMAQGIIEKWSQPIAYAFISYLGSSSDISVWVEEIVTLLIDIGLDVRAFVSDPKTESLYMPKGPAVTKEKPYFTINDKKIYHIYDINELVTFVDNDLRDCEFRIGSNIEGDANDNRPFMGKFIQLWSMLNSKSLATKTPEKRAFTNSKYQRSFLKEMLSLFQNLRVIERYGRDITKKAKYIESIQILIISIMQLYKDLRKSGARVLRTRRVTQDCLRTLFYKTESRYSYKVSTRQFKASFARYFVYNLLKRPVGDRKKSSGFDAQSLLPASKLIDQAVKVDATDYRSALPERKRFATVCRYLYLKCIDQHSCDTFKEFLSRSRESRQYVAPYRATAPLGIWNCKLVPPRKFRDFVTALEKRFKDYCNQEEVKIFSIGHQILKKLGNIQFDQPCPCFPTDYVKKLFVRLRIYHTVRENNVMLKRQKWSDFKTFDL